MEEFESRVEKFIQVNIESDECSHWVDILRLEFGGEDKFCGDGFTNAVSELKCSEYLPMFGEQKPFELDQK